MVFASKLALFVNQWSSGGNRRQLALIEKTGLPTSLPAGLNIEKILVSLTADKKVKSGQVRFVLPVEIGEANISDQVTANMIRQVLGNGE